MTRIILISALFWILSLLIYRLILKKYTFHQLNRWYLLLTLIGGALLPFLPRVQVTESPFVVLLKPVTIGLEAITNEAITPIVRQGVDYKSFLWLIYGVVTTFLLMQILKNILQIRRKAKRGKIVVHEGIEIVYSSEIQQPFSFWKWIFLNDQISIDSIILEHEYAHIKGRHSWDKILVQLLGAIYWIIPIFGYYKKYINEVQEYIADEYVLHHTSKKKYSYFLLGQTNIAITPALSNNFHSLIKNRITMILKEKTKKYHKIWYLPVLVLVVGMASVIIVSCETEPSVVPESKVAMEEKADNYNLLEVTDTVTTFDPKTNKESVEIVRSEIKVYKKVDIMPMYSLNGCEDSTDKKEREMCANNNLLQRVYKNIVYPKGIKKEGTVILQFVVDKEGFMIDPKIIKTIDPSFSKVVLDMYSKIQQKWIPGSLNGQNVAVQFILPIKFKLED